MGPPLSALSDDLWGASCKQALPHGVPETVENGYPQLKLTLHFSLVVQGECLLSGCWKLSKVMFFTKGFMDHGLGTTELEQSSYNKRKTASSSLKDLACFLDEVDRKREYNEWKVKLSGKYLF